MSNRALRKLNGGKDDLSALASSLQLEEEIEEHVPKKSQKQKKVINMFDLLNENGENFAEESPPERENDSARSDSEVPPPVRPTGTKSKKKLKKKAKKQQVESEDVDFDEEFFLDSAAACEAGNKAQAPAVRSKSVLNIEQKSLNPDNELKKIFGSKVVQSGQKKKARGRAYVKSAWLMNPKDNWAMIRKTGLSMVIDQQQKKDGFFYFKFEHNKEYRLVQMSFWEAVASLNPQNIVAIVNTFPYHIDALIQLSEIGRISDDLQMATELIERALYIMESAFHPSFNLASGNCRLPYRQQENRALFLIIFKHLVCIGQRGCYRTALEFCKVLYTLDMDADPLAVVLMIDFYALKAQEFAWFIDFFDFYEPSKNLSQLPNMAYAIALAHFYQSKGDASALERADEYLKKALLMFPAVLIPMLDKCSIQPDHRVKTHSYFSPITSPNHPSALDNLMQLYIGRSFHTWKDPDLLPWLERNAHSCMAQIDADPSVTSDYEEKRKVRYQGTPRNIYRHIILSDIKDATAALPQELADSVTSFDPLPPTDSVSSYNRPVRNTDSSSAAASEGDGGLLSTFFRSMMPDFNPQQPNDNNQPPYQLHIERLAAAAAAADAEERREDQQVEGAGANLQRNVATLVNAMRDLLGSIHLPDLGRNDDQDGDEEEADVESE
uniref:EOG090X0BCY n=1 Tax=Evadne anonyx TaxID=141404 RepID=A0A9N6WSA9_9CRUS|nr:EOG090X0BCY [Evadne anonyx]